MAHPRKADPGKYCQHCGTRLERKRFNGTLEDMNRFLLRKYCDQTCMALHYMHNNPSKEAVYKRLEKIQKSRCEICGTTENLCNHHRDRNWRNNDPSNFQTLCNSCHTSLHHARGDILKKKENLPCYVCGKPSYRSGLCNTCRTRQRRHGSPYLKRIRIGASWQVVMDASGLNGQAFQGSQSA